jgi:hypothetical protein
LRRYNSKRRIEIDNRRDESRSGRDDSSHILHQTLRFWAPLIGAVVSLIPVGVILYVAELLHIKIEGFCPLCLIVYLPAMIGMLIGWRIGEGSKSSRQ